MSSSLRPIYYDTETTGIKAEEDRIIELAAYDPVLDKTFVELIYPNRPIPKEATAIHQITDEMVQGADTFGKVAIRFTEFCSGNVVLIAHNNDNFDKLFLQQEFQRENIPLPPWQYLDTLKWARKYRSDLPRHSLQFLREVYGFEENQAHRALDDVIMLHQIFSQMIDNLTIDQVIELMNAPQQITRMPFGKYQGKHLSQVPQDYLAWLKRSGAFDKPENSSLFHAFCQLGMLSS